MDAAVKKLIVRNQWSVARPQGLVGTLQVRPFFPQTERYSHGLAEARISSVMR